MENIVISKQGVEILIFKFEKPTESEKFDRSIFIDITHYRNVVFNLYGVVAFLCFVIGFVISGSNEFREMMPKSY